MFGRTRSTPIGLDIGTRRIKAVQARTMRDGLVISAASCITRRTPDVPMLHGEAVRIVDTLMRQGFTGTDVVLGMPSDRMLSGVLELPPRTSGAPLDMIARQELARSCKCEAQTLEVAWWELPAAGRAGEGTHAIAMGCKHEDALPILDAFERAGLEAVALDAGPAALARAVAPIAGAAPELTAVLDMGWSAAHLLIMHGRVLVYERAIRELGIRQLHRQLHEQCDMDDELADFLLRTLGCATASDLENSGSQTAPQTEDSGGMEQEEEARTVIVTHADNAAAELRVSVGYAQRRFEGALSRVLVVGGGAQIPGMVARITQRLDGTSGAASLGGGEGMVTRAVRADQVAAASAGLALETVDASSLCALGLALHGCAAPVGSGGCA